jgi:hypothetical protein
MSHEQNSGRNYNIQRGNKSFERAENCIELGKTLTNDICTCEES